ncbi:MAG: hypothetical protein QM669_04120 [Siphonobacter sp.]
MSEQLSIICFRISSQIWSAFTLALISFASFGQGLGNSPYSTFGIGEMLSGTTAAQQMMGGSGVSYTNGLFINNLNPALLARNRVTTLEVGGMLQVKQMQDILNKQKVTGGNLSYLSMAFPLNSRWTASFNYAPYSFLDYKITTYSEIAGSSYYALMTNNGTGASNKISLSTGYRLYKNLYVGVTGSYLFGTTTREQSSQTVGMNDGYDYQIVISDIDRMSNPVFKAGASYRFKLAEKRYLNVGGTYDLPARINGKRVQSYAEFIGDTPVTNSSDTLSYNKRVHMNLPGGFRAGLSFENPYRLAISADVAYQQWSKFRDFDRDSQGFRDTYQFNLGLEYTPNVMSSSNYFSRIPYRFGINYTQLPYNLTNRRINEASITFGVGLPLNKVGLSDANLGFTVGQRGRIESSVFKEQFFRVTLGFTISDQWFYRQVVD